MVHLKNKYFFYKTVLIIAISTINFFCAGCPYSFTGSAIPTHLKTIGISLFEENSNFGEAGLREKITKVVTDKIINDNSLKVTDKKIADSVLEGVILRITDKPATVVSGEQISKRRIEIVIKVTYTDMIKRKKVFEREFTNWGDYSSTGSGFAQRQEGLDAAIEKISEDILLQTVSGW